MQMLQIYQVYFAAYLDEHGKILCKNAFDLISDDGIETYSFSPQMTKNIEEQEVPRLEDQALMSILVSQLLDFMITNDDRKVPVSELQGKVVGVYIQSLDGPPSEFTQTLVQDRRCNKLACCLRIKQNTYYNNLELPDPPILTIIGPDGNILHSNVIEIVKEHRVEAYPFTPEKLAELKEVKQAEQEPQTLESILVSDSLDFLIDRGGVKIPVSDLVGKTILVSFLSRWTVAKDWPLKVKYPEKYQFEDAEEYDLLLTRTGVYECFQMFNDGDIWRDAPGRDGKIVNSNAVSVLRKFGCNAYPWTQERIAEVEEVVNKRLAACTLESILISWVKDFVINKSGDQIPIESMATVIAFGPSDAYPFTEEHLREVEAQVEEMAMEWPRTVKHVRHKNHDLILRHNRTYECSICNVTGVVWTYFCEGCNSKYHPSCVLKDDTIGLRFVLSDYGHYANDGEEETICES
ncbi:DC1 domain-containing protein [Quillaja saponaria]|uniref:DC1 domain-containing protein n=1 Tax=Quillaja saponaria TaxID=32244 RepID=A0AAD7L8P6_QUISA|nr:DC1 domain-containing protein [Quillaja saponaria]